MISVSDAFNEAFRSPKRRVLTRITMNDVVYTNNDVFSVSYENGSITGESFSIGSTFSNSIKITFSKIIEGVKQLDKIKLEFGIVLADGTSEYVSMGYFFVSSYDPDRNENRTTIEAYDAMSQMEGSYESELTYPATLLAVATEIANKSGMTIDTASFQRLPSKTIAKIEGKTYRQAIGLIAQFACGFVTFNREGKLAIRTLSDPDFSVSTADYFSKGLSKDETMYKLDGINCKVKTSDSEESTLQSGIATGNQISLENDVMTQIYLDDIYQQLKSLNYYPFSLSWRGNPALEAGDWISMADTKENSFKMPNLSYKLEFSGGLKATSSAETKSIASSTVQFQGTLKQKVAELEGWKNASGGWTYSGIAEPINPQEGDVWFKPNGPDTETWIYENGQWVFKTSTAGITEAKQTAQNAEEVANQSSTNAQTALNNANNAVEDVGNLADRVSTAEGKITLLSDRMNFRITNSDGSVTQIDLADKVISLSGEQVNITGNTYIANGVIETANIADLAVTDAKIGNISADKINVGTLNGGNVNIINLNASNITSGTISGTNLSINLATGVVNFQKGVIQKTDGKFKIDITNGSVESYQSSGGFTLKDGTIELRDSSIFNSSGITYGKISWGLGLFSAQGLSLRGLNGWELSTTNSSYASNLIRSEGSGIFGNDELTIFAKNRVKIYGGSLTTPQFVPSVPCISVGCNYNSTSEVGADIDLSGNWVQFSVVKGVRVNGNFSVIGSKNAIHKVGNDWIATPAYETAESYLGDIGSNQTNESGEVTINVEYLFSRIVNTNMEYQVFVSSYGEGHVWVEQRYPLFFVVKSSKPNTPFAFEIKAKRKGYEFDRLVKQAA